MRSVGLWEGATPRKYDAVLAQLSVQGQLLHADAVASAGAALARASTYLPDLDLARLLAGGNIGTVVKRGDEIVALLPRHPGRKNPGSAPLLQSMSIVRRLQTYRPR